MFEVVPYGHSWQCIAPVNDAYDPGVQRTQRYWPGCDLAKPGRQRLSVVAPPSSTMISTPALGTAAGKHGDMYMTMCTEQTAALPACNACAHGAETHMEA